MTHLKTDHIYSSPSRYAWDKVNGLEKLIITPEPTADDIDYFGYSPEELAMRGYQVPAEDSDAHQFAENVFKKSEEYREWRQKFIPELTTLWPCNPSVPINDAAAAIYRQGLQCVLIKGDINGVTEISGIAILPGEKGEVSDHLAAAYICCGQIPPSSLMVMALSRRNPAMRDELIEVASTIKGELASLGSAIENRAKELPFPTAGRRGP